MLLILMAVGPPVLAGAWLWCRQLIADAVVLLACEFYAAAILFAVLAATALLWAIAMRAALADSHSRAAKSQQIRPLRGKLIGPLRDTADG
jgi:hypothetical protein